MPSGATAARLSKPVPSTHSKVHAPASGFRLPSVFQSQLAPANRRFSTDVRLPASPSHLDQGTSTSSSPSSSDLQTIRGVGPVYTQKLIQNNIPSIKALQETFHNKYNSDRDELQRFLQEDVGIKAHHCRNVVEYIESLDYETFKHNAVTLAVEGNIGVGKSTFLNILTEPTIELQDVIVVQEPVDEWQTMRTQDGKPLDLLQKFYEDPDKYAYAFQHMVLMTRVAKDRSTRNMDNARLRILERSIFSDRMVFVRALHEAGNLSDIELNIYDSFFSMELNFDKQLVPEGFIYLKAAPETCEARMRHRNRDGESNVDLNYLHKLHEKHEHWLNFGARKVDDFVQTVSRLEYTAKGLGVSPHINAFSRPGNGSERSEGVMSVLPLGRLSNSKSILDIPSSIRDSVYILGADEATRQQQEELNVYQRHHQPHHSHSMATSSSSSSSSFNSRNDAPSSIKGSLLGVPALMLDHDQDSILHDPMARADYAKKVRDFQEFVGKYRWDLAQTKPGAAAGPVFQSDLKVGSFANVLEECKRVTLRAAKRDKQLGIKLDGLMKQLESYLPYGTKPSLLG